MRVADLIAYVNHDIDDATRAGLLRPEDLPVEPVRTLKHPVTLAQMKAEPALAEIYRRHGGAVHALARRVLRSDPPAEEITQEIFIKLWLCRDILNQVENLDGYILGEGLSCQSAASE